MEASSMELASLDVASLDVSPIVASLDVASLDVASLDVASLDVASLDVASLDVASTASLDVGSLGVASTDVASLASMEPFSLRWVLLALVLLVGGVGFAFYRHQNRARAGSAALGGGISRAKAAWLTFAVLFWLGVCPLLALEPTLPLRWRVALGVFAAQFWLRGIVELYMLYVTKSWRPPYGIAHDVFSLLLVVALVAAPGPFPLDGAHLVGFAATALVALSLVAETYYAWVFLHLVEGKTTGDDGVWFADQHDPRFVRMNRLTAALNVPLYAGLALIVGVAFGGL